MEPPDHEAMTSHDPNDEDSSRLENVVHVFVGFTFLAKIMPSQLEKRTSIIQLS